MKSIQLKLLFFLLAIAMGGFFAIQVRAQQVRPEVDVRINFSDYDVIYLTDFIDVKTQKLSSAISGISLDLNVKSPPDQSIQVCVYIEVQIQLRGDPGLQRLVNGFTKDFSINGSRTLTAYDFAKNGGGISVVDAGYEENSGLKKRFEDLAKTIPTAPPGTYQITMKVLPPGSRNPSGEYGGDSKTIVIPYSATEEVFVEINDPTNGSYFTNLAPIFSWTTGASHVTLRVYEAGVNHRSPQDALTGSNPHLVRNLTNVTTFTYPGNAERQLQENKAYVLQVEAKVLTNRGETGNFSRPVVFRITGDRVGKMLDDFLNVLGGTASSKYSTLRSDPTTWVPWSPYGNITLDGNSLSEADMQTLLKELAVQPDLKLELGIENK